MTGRGVLSEDEVPRRIKRVFGSERVFERKTELRIKSLSARRSGVNEN